MNTPRRLDEFRLALMLLTRLPVGRLGDDAPPLGSSQWAFPLTGLITGLAGWLAHEAALLLNLGPVLAALLAVGALVLVTGALHFDGLADFADGIGGGRDRDRRLEIMRDSRIGTYGVVALIFAVSVQVAAIAQSGAAIPLFAFLLSGVASRLAMVVLLTALPPARTDGLGHSAVGRGASWIAGTVATGTLVIAVGIHALPALLLAALGAALVAALARRHLGGQTGDVLGAAQVVSETALWVGLAATLGP